VPERRAGDRVAGRKRKQKAGIVDDRPTGPVSTERKKDPCWFYSRDGMGKAPGRKNPRRARTPIAPGKPGGGRPNRPEDETPEARPLRGNPERGAASRTVDDPGHCRSAERPLRQEAVKQVGRLAEGRYPRRRAPVSIPARPGTRSQSEFADRKRGGSAERRAIPARSSSEGRTP
jgi:hypothetical protein